MRSILAVFLLACTGTAWAQSAEFWFSAGESIVSSPLGADPSVCTTTALCQQIGESPSDIKLSNGFRFSLRIALNQADHFGHEVQYAYNRTALNYSASDPATGGTAMSQGFAIHQFGYNFLYYATKDDAKVRPFATGGVGGNNFVPPGSSAASGGGQTKFGFNYGGGVKMKVKGPWAARVDFRQYTSPKPFGLPEQSGWLHQEEVSAGVGFVF
jgi:opacity protein-like surface antigen